MQVARIIDKTNRAYKSDKRGNPTGFAALAAKDIEAYTVLGTYGGITARTSDLDEDTALVESGENYSFSLDLTAQYESIVCVHTSGCPCLHIRLIILLYCYVDGKTQTAKWPRSPSMVAA